MVDVMKLNTPNFGNNTWGENNETEIIPEVDNEPVDLSELMKKFRIDYTDNNIELCPSKDIYEAELNQLSDEDWSWKAYDENDRYLKAGKSKSFSIDSIPGAKIVRMYYRNWMLVRKLSKNLTIPTKIY